MKQYSNSIRAIEPKNTYALRTKLKISLKKVEPETAL